MWSDYSYSPQFVPETYVVSPSVKGERVPVLKSPEAYNQVLAYLVPCTLIEVMFKLDYWLYVVVPGKVEGYIYAPDARPATNADFEASAPTSSLHSRGYPLGRGSLGNFHETPSRRKNKRMVTRDGATARSLYFFLEKWGNLCLFVASLGVLIGGVNLFGLGMVDCAATHAGTECVSSLETWGAVLIFGGAFVVVYAVYKLVAQLARKFSSSTNLKNIARSFSPRA